MRYLYTFAATVLAAALLCGFFPTTAEAAVYDDVLRLHVLAASDSTDDQTRKLAVRDALLEATAPLLADCTSRDEAANRLRAAIPTLTTLAEQISAQPAAVTLTYESYPTRSYAAAALPAGEYLSLRVILGEGEGQNWWCVLFPPLCLGAASENTCIEAGLTPEAYRIITAQPTESRPKIKFKLLELLTTLLP